MENTNPVDYKVLNTIQALIDILSELENIDSLGSGISIKIKIINKIDELIDKL
jgi:hypothetical protein